MKLQALIATAAVMLTIVVLPASAQEATDREKIVDVAELRAAMDEATSGIRRHLERSQLQSRFERVAELLQSGEVNKAELVDALKALKAEMDLFTMNWEDDVAAPLWDGQDAVAATIDRVRLMLARSATDKPSQKVQKRLEHFDDRLTSLAKTIEAETDPFRKERLKTVFANVFSLRQLVEQYPVDLGAASTTVQVKLIQALSSLENQLLSATFQIERARVVLDQESEFVGMYVGVLEGVLEAEALLGMLDQMRSDGTGVGDLVSDLGALTAHVETFASAAEGFLDQAADSLQAETSRLAESTTIEEVGGVDIDDALMQYLNRETKADAELAKSN